MAKIIFSFLVCTILSFSSFAEDKKIIPIFKGDLAPFNGMLVPED